jgi:hypothetical protein
MATIAGETYDLVEVELTAERRLDPPGQGDPLPLRPRREPRGKSGPQGPRGSSSPMRRPGVTIDLWRLPGYLGERGGEWRIGGDPERAAAEADRRAPRP